FLACTRSPNEPGEPRAPGLVLAFYYPWYGRADGPSQRWYHWPPVGPAYASTNAPSLGMYDSNDAAVVRQQIAWAKAAGIDGFIASWWGPESFEDRSLRLLLDEAEQEGFLVTVIVEQRRRSFEAFERDYRALLIT